MIELLLKYLSVFGLSMLKFIFGPVTGVSMGLGIVEIWLLTSSGMMATVVIITFAGTEFRQWLVAKFAKKQTSATGNKRMLRLWNRYGMLGVAFLTPLILSPPGGAIMAVSFGEKKHRILTYMLGSALIWGLIFAIFITLAGDTFSKLTGIAL